MKIAVQRFRRKAPTACARGPGKLYLKASKWEFCFEPPEEASPGPND
jgi:hypothetical protein